MFKLFYLSVDTLRRRTNPTNNEHTAIRECSHLLKLIGPDLNQCWSLFVSFTEPLTIYCQPNTQNHWSRTTTRIASTEKNLHLLWWQPTPNHPCLYKLHLTSTFRTYSKKIAILSRIWTYSSISNARGRLSSFRWQKIISKWVKWGKGRGFSLLPSPAENLIVRTRVFWKFTRRHCGAQTKDLTLNYFTLSYRDLLSISTSPQTEFTQEFLMQEENRVPK